jgi:hypothetical protein
VVGLCFDFAPRRLRLSLTRYSRYGATNIALIHKSRYIQQESVASRVQLRNPTIDLDRNAAAHHACLLYERQDGSYLNLIETYSFLDHYDQNDQIHHF